MTDQIEPFDFDSPIEPTRWLVEDLLPLGQLIINFARSGHGKSFWVEEAATKIVHGQQFLQRPTLAGDVLIIDQDTPTNVIKSRLTHFRSNPIYVQNGATQPHHLYVLSHKGLSFSNSTLAKAIKSFPSVCLVIIDSLHSVSGGLNLNWTTDANHAFGTLRSCVTPDRTVWINHHISEKKMITLDEMMFGEQLGDLFMGSSAIVQQVDTVHIMSGVNHENALREIYDRPWGKRAFISQKPFLASFDGVEFKYEGVLEDTTDLDESVLDLRLLFSEHTERGFLVKEAYEEMGRKHGINKLYRSLATLEQSGEIRMQRGGSNQFRYFAAESLAKPQVIIRHWPIKTRILVEQQAEEDDE